MEQTLQQQKDKGLRLNQSLGQYFKNEKGETYKNIYIYNYNKTIFIYII